MFLLFLVLPALLFSSCPDNDESILLQNSWKEMMHKKQNQQEDSYAAIEVEPSSRQSHPFSLFYTNQVGFLLLAGGQGSRLGSSSPKGMVPIPPSNKTLFEIFFRRAIGFHRLYNVWPHIAIMTSEDTDKDTKEYLKKNSYFGIPEKFISFFCQKSLPLLNENGFPFKENGIICHGPDGNGKVFSTFYESEIFPKWQKEQVQAILCLPIDNPMMDPLLPALFQPVLTQQCDVSFAALERSSPTEKVGVFFQRDHRLHVIEYSEIPETLRSAKTPSNELLHKWANISVLCLSMNTIKELHNKPLPLHFAKKMRDSSPIYKAEYFIFDNFPYIATYKIVGLDRKRYFSPIKAKTGEDSLEEASKAFSRLQKEQATRLGLSYSENDPSFLDPAEIYSGN